MLVAPRAASVYLPDQIRFNHLLIQKFTRQSRLLRPAEFQRVFKQPMRSGDESFRVLARPNGTSSHRLGMAVAKKACPKAVGRNRIKRLVRENFRKQMAGQLSPENVTPENVTPEKLNSEELLSEKLTPLALDFVVLATPLAAKQSNKVLDESLSSHWQKLTRKAVNRVTG